MTVAGGGEKWRWADPKGVQRIVHADEMRAALASGSLPPYTLVWRPGMAEWQPAYLVPELATTAIPVSASGPGNIPPPPMAVVAVQAQFEKRQAEADDKNAPQPPPPPVHQYAAIAAAVPPHVTRAIKEAQAASARAKEMKRRSARNTGNARAKPTQDNAETWVKTSPIQAMPAPAQAMPAPAQAAPQPSAPVSQPRSAPPLSRPPLSQARSVAPPPPPRRSLPAPASRPPASLRPGGGDAPLTNGLPHVPLPSHPAGSVDAAAGDLPSFPLDDLDVGSEKSAPSPAQPRAFARATSAATDRRAPASPKGDGDLRARAQRIADIARVQVKNPRVVLGVGAGVLALLLVAGVVALASAHKSDVVDPSAAVPSAAAAVESATGSETMPASRKAVATAREREPAAPPSSCRMAGVPARLSPRAWKDAPLELRAGPSENVRLGFAADASSAQGISFALRSFEPTVDLSIRTAGRIRAVVPLGGANRGFAVSADAKGGGLSGWYPVSAAPPLLLGWSDGAISVAEGPSATPRALWKMDGEDVPDAFRTAEGRDGAIAVAFRRHGAIFAGWFDRDRQARGPLVQVAGAGAAPGSPVGSPVLGTNGDALAIAFADRASPDRQWSVWIGSAPLGSVPKQATQFELPPGGPGGAAFAPALSGLPDGRWLIAWTEGAGGNHDVRAQTLTSDLAPLGTALTVSGALGNTGQGAVALSEGQGAVAYLALTGHGYEVWGTRLDCR